MTFQTQRAKRVHFVQISDILSTGAIISLEMSLPRARKERTEDQYMLTILL